MATALLFKTLDVGKRGVLTVLSYTFPKFRIAEFGIFPVDIYETALYIMKEYPLRRRKHLPQGDAAPERVPKGGRKGIEPVPAPLKN